MKVDPTGGPKSRADAARNRARLLETAKSVFATKGSASSLDEIARTAGVGTGTLYRHFANRDALIEAVYREETDQLVAAAARLAEAHPPLTALREWLLLFVDAMTLKQAMAEVINSMAGSTSNLYAASGGRVKTTIAELVARAVANGVIHLEMEPLDLLRALAAVATVSRGSASSTAAKRLVDILITGIRT